MALCRANKVNIIVDELSISGLHAVATEAAGAILPIEAVREGSGRREHVGSCFALETGHLKLLITAQHVIAGLHRAYVIGPSGELAVPTDPALGDNVADVAAWPINNQQIVNLGISTFLNDPKLALRNVVAGSYFVAMGHPTAKSRRTDAQTILRTKCMVVTGRLRALTVEDPAHLQPSIHFAGDYDPSAVCNLDGKGVSPGKATGISGGALLMPMSIGGAGGIPLLMPIGVITEFHRQAHLLVGTTLAHVMDLFGQ